MGQLMIRDVDDAMIQQLTAQAVAAQQSLEQRVREILAVAVSAGQTTNVANLAATTDRTATSQMSDPMGIMDDAMLRKQRLSLEERLAKMHCVRPMIPPVPPNVQWSMSDSMIREEGDTRGDDLVAMADQITAMGPSRIDVDVVALIRADREMR